MTRFAGCLGRFRGALLALAITLLLIPVFSGVALADTFTANLQTDAPDGDPGDGRCDAVLQTPGKQCTLRATVQETNARDGRDTINLIEGTYLLTIPNRDNDGNGLPDPEAKAATGDLDIRDEETTVRGAGLSRTIIQDEAGDRIFHVHIGGSRASITGLTTTGGNGTPVPGTPVTDGVLSTDLDGLSTLGGGIFNASVVTLRNVAVRDSEADFGGGLYNRGTLTLESSTVGGATSDGNTAFFGGGVYNDGPLRINDSTVSSNTARREPFNDLGGFGGGLYDNTATARLTNTTIAQNTADVRGGGIDNVFGDVLLNNVTVFQNNSPNGTNIANNGSRTYLSNTIVARGAAVSENCAGERTVSRGNNLSDDDSCNLNEPSDQENTEPRLAPIQDDDDPNAVIFEPQSGSPAIDKGNNATCQPFDQRGVKRPKDGDGNGKAICDVGSVEARTLSSGA